MDDNSAGRQPEAGAEMARHIQAIARDADKAAFTAVFEAFAPRIKAYLIKLGGDAGAAEELTQETMVNVWRKAALFDPTRASAATWIFTIARNLRIDAFRRERHPELDPQEPALRIDSEMPADARLEAIEASDAVIEAFAGLSEAERRLLQLAYYEDKSHSMIATELGLPLGTVKSRMRQVFAKLRLRLAGTAGEA